MHDFNLNWIPTDRLQLAFSVQNIFDRNYIAQGSPYANGTGAIIGLAEPGRDFRLSASYMF